MSEEMRKNCLGCRWCYIDAGEPDLSEVTPGDPFDCSCRKGHWILTQRNFYKKTLGECISKAEDCKDWEPS